MRLKFILSFLFSRCSVHTSGWSEWQGRQILYSTFVVVVFFFTHWIWIICCVDRRTEWMYYFLNSNSSLKEMKNWKINKKPLFRRMLVSIWARKKEKLKKKSKQKPGFFFCNSSHLCYIFLVQTHTLRHPNQPRQSFRM